MRLRHVHRVGAAAMLAVTLGISTHTTAQIPPWEIRTDPQTLTDCAVINAENVELIVLEDTGELVIVSEDGLDVVDTVILDTQVDAIGNVFFLDAQVGQIAFAEDATGRTTMWWLDTLSDRVYQYDTVLELPILGNLAPFDVVGLDCDPCPVWDFPEDCGVLIDDGHTDGGGINTSVPAVTINFCGTNTALSMMLTLAGLVGTGLVRRPRKPLT